MNSMPFKILNLLCHVILKQGKVVIHDHTV